MEKVKELFHAARTLSPNERASFLDRSCSSNLPLRLELEALLRSNEEASDSFMTGPPAGLAAEVFGEVALPSAVGHTIGQYKLLERIGSGGMGDVYLAERADRQFEMKAAIKLIKRGMDTESVLRRFQHERQILASLEHPNIARLLDGGETQEGLPYFVMEYVVGERVDRYAEKQGLSIEQRLELFRQICGAVTYAHQHLVVHRDLKPSNILVTGAGVPKLLDFGIAKTLEGGEGASGALVTMTMSPIMTPEYASPEQIEGGPTTTFSDVYSLGAVLYQLLSGRPPHRLNTRSAQKFAETIARGSIEKPSAVVDRPDLARRLRGDLDNIVLMAMRRETARRYRSVEQFSEDIRRYLIGRPVVARPDLFSYRAHKFLQRNKIAVAAGVLIFVSLVGGIVATTWEARRARAEQARAERRFNDVRHLANNVLFDYHDAIKTLPGATKVRERLVKDALSYLDSLAGEARGDPALQRELAAAYEKVGDVRGGEGNGNLGDIAGAVDSYAKSLRIREALLTLNPKDVQARRDVAASEGKLGYGLVGTARKGEGLDHLRKARSLFFDLERENPANPTLQVEFADACTRLGKILGDHNDFGPALEQIRAALAIYEQLAATNPQDQTYRRGLWTSHEKIGYVLWMQGDSAGALAENGAARALGEALLKEDPVNADYRRRLVLSYQYAGNCFRDTNDNKSALEYYRKAAALDEQLLVTDPGNALTRKDLAYTDKNIAELLVDLADNSQALLHFSKALENYEKVVVDAPADLASQFLVVTCSAAVAQMQARLGKVESALEGCRKAETLLDGIAGGKTDVGRAQAYEYLGHAYSALTESSKGSASESRQYMSTARDMFRQALDILDDLRGGGTLGANEEWAREIAGQIAQCDKALGK